MNPIEISELHKRFGSFPALAGLDLAVAPGEVHGFLGPNGAGKSTTIRILLGQMRATSGTVRLFGRDPWRDAVSLHARLAYVPGDVSLWPNITGGEAIDFLSRLRGGVDQRRRDALIERFELDPTKRSRTYSKGNRQKVALVAALASDAELMILDEPTSGLDPLMEAVFTDEVRRAKEAGRSVLLSSHILSEVEKLCDTVTIIRRGAAVESGSLDDLRHLTRTHIDVVLDTPADPGDVEDLERDGDRMTFTVDGASLGDVLARLVPHGIRSLTATPPSLEDLFLRHYGDERSAERELAS